MSQPALGSRDCHPTQPMSREGKVQLDVPRVACRQCLTTVGHLASGCLDSVGGGVLPTLLYWGGQSRPPQAWDPDPFPGACKTKGRQAHQVLDGRPRKAAKALLGCLKASCWVYPAGAEKCHQRSGSGSWWLVRVCQMGEGLRERGGVCERQDGGGKRKEGLGTGRGVWKGGQLTGERDSERAGGTRGEVRTSQRRGGSERRGFSSGFRGKGDLASEGA